MSCRNSTLLLALLCVSGSFLLTSGTAEGVTITGVTIEDFSSQLYSGTPGVGFDRRAFRTVDGSGLTPATAPPGTHTNTQAPRAIEELFWLSTGNGGAGGGVDPTPGTDTAVITFDLGANYDLDSFHLWNYNEINLANRGAQNVQIQVASTDIAPVFTNVGGPVLFPIANGGPADPGSLIPLLANNVRLVRFNILSNYSTTEDFVGLSEVRFNAVVPEPSTMLIWGLFGTGGACIFAWRRKLRRA